MEFRLSKMGYEGKVAMANLGLCGLSLVLLLPFVLEKQPGPVLSTAGYVAGVLFAVLSFPIGWLSVLFWVIGAWITNAQDCPALLAAKVVPPAILVPLNAYVWGWMAKRIQARSSRKRLDWRR